MPSMPENKYSENSLVAVGDSDVVMGFAALGFKVYAIEEQAEMSAILEEIIRQEPAVCLVQDNIYQAQAGKINQYRSLALPIFIPFSKEAKVDLLGAMVKDIRLRATGTYESGA